MATPARKAIDPLELERYRPQLVKFAMLQLRDAAAAEDAAQEALVAAIQSAGSFAGQSSVKTWLIGILKHKIIDAMRRRSREQPLAIADDETSVDDLQALLFTQNGHFQDQPADWGDPDAALTQRRFFEALEGCLADLPKNTARAFTMREVMGLDTGEICKELGITPSNCWVLLYRARMALRECLEQRWFGGKAAAKP